MFFRSNLWLLTLSVPFRVADAVGEALGGEAVALTVIAPLRKESAEVEALYDQEPDSGELQMKLVVLAMALDFPVPHATVRPVPKLDWLKKVAQDFPPLRIARWTVHGALHRDKVSSRRHALQIDATNAFGTGEHPTTRGCLLMLDRLLKTGFRPCRMADIGCGSGILAMGCVQASRGAAVAVDLDPDSVLIAKGNVRGNGLGAKIRVARGRGYVGPLVREAAPYDLIMANIFADPLCRMAKDLKANLAPGGVAILSGLLTSQAKKVVGAHRMQGLALIDHKIIGEWSILMLKNNNRA